MKKPAVFMAIPLVLLAFRAEPQTDFRSGTVTIVPDPAFGTGTEWDSLFKRSDVWTMFLPDGAFVRTASADGQVHKFDPDGNLIKSFGRSGQGPGDLMSPGALDVIDGKTLVVNDAGNRRLSLFDLDGSFLKTAKLTVTGGPVLSIAALDGGRVAYVVQETRQGEPTVIASRLRVMIKDLETNEETELAVYDWERPRSKFMLRVVPWEPTVYLARIGPDRLLVSFSANPDIAFFSVSGRKTESFSLQGERTSITWKHLEFLNPQGFEFMAKNKADIEFPDFFPYYPKLAVDSEGRILIYDDNQARLSRDVSFKAYAQSGELLGSVRIDSGRYAPVMPLHFRNGYAYCDLTEKEGDDSFVFARFRIVPETHPNCP